MRLYIHESDDAACIAKASHRSGVRPLPLSVGDLLRSSDGATECGQIRSVTIEHVEPEVWVYRVNYAPVPGTLHPVWSCVLWNASKPAVDLPEAIASRMAVQPAAAQPVIEPQLIEVGPPIANGRKKRNKQTTGQSGVVAPASA